MVGERIPLGLMRALIWKRDVPVALAELQQKMGATPPMPPPVWVTALLVSDMALLEANTPGA